MDDTDPTVDAAGTTRRLILNPVSGHGDHVERIHRLAEEYGFPVEETRQEGDAVDLAMQAAADDVDLLAVCGGDGTLHEVVVGFHTAEALDAVTLCISPVGTENIVATDLGVQEGRDAFEVAERGETREIDLGLAGDEPFVMSAIAGLPADVSGAATQERKHRFGSFAFVVGALQEGLSFDGLRVEVDAISPDTEVEWAGEALAVLVGNVRQFAKTGGQANAEDGLLELTIVEQMPPGDVVAEAIEQRLFHQDTSHVRDLQAASLAIESLEDSEIRFSLDGEIRSFETVQIRTLPRSLRVRVGPEYDPNPT